LTDRERWRAGRVLDGIGMARPGDLLGNRPERPARRVVPQGQKRSPPRTWRRLAPDRFRRVFPYRPSSLPARTGLGGDLCLEGPTGELPWGRGDALLRHEATLPPPCATMSCGYRSSPASRGARAAIRPMGSDADRCTCPDIEPRTYRIARRNARWRQSPERTDSAVFPSWSCAQRGVIALRRTRLTLRCAFPQEEGLRYGCSRGRRRDEVPNQRGDRRTNRTARPAAVCPGAMRLPRWGQRAGEEFGAVGERRRIYRRQPLLRTIPTPSSASCAAGPGSPEGVTVLSFCIPGKMTFLARHDRES
jgi:hypothetical protein